MAYTVGVKRRFFPGYRTFRVRDHSVEPGAVVLYCEDGNQYAFYGLDGRQVRVYPDYQKHAHENEMLRPIPKLEA